MGLSVLSAFVTASSHTKISPVSTEHCRQICYAFCWSELTDKDISLPLYAVIVTSLSLLCVSILLAVPSPPYIYICSIFLTFQHRQLQPLISISISETCVDNIYLSYFTRAEPKFRAPLLPNTCHFADSLTGIVRLAHLMILSSIYRSLRTRSFLTKASWQWLRNVAILFSPVTTCP